MTRGRRSNRSLLGAFWNHALNPQVTRHQPDLGMRGLLPSHLERPLDPTPPRGSDLRSLLSHWQALGQHVPSHKLPPTGDHTDARDSKNLHQGKRLARCRNRFQTWVFLALASITPQVFTEA